MLSQVWSSRSVSPLSDVQTPNGTEPKRLFADTVIKVTDDGWRTVTQGSPPESHFVSKFLIASRQLIIAIQGCVAIHGISSFPDARADKP